MGDLPIPQLQLAFGVFTAIGTAVAIPQIAAIWRKRTDPIIRNRGFASLMIINIGCFFCFLLLGLAGTFNLSCILYPVSLALLMFMFLFSFERIIVIYVLYLVTLKSREYAKDNLGFNKLQLEDAQFSPSSMGYRVQEWLFHNRSKINTTNFFCKTKIYEYCMATVTGVAVFGLYALLGPQSLSKPFLSDECISTGQATWKWLFIGNFGIMLAVAWLPSQLRKMKENYFTLREYAAFSKFAVTCVISIPIHAFYPKSVFPSRTVYYFWMMIIMQTTIFIFCGYVLMMMRIAQSEEASNSLPNAIQQAVSQNFSKSVFLTVEETQRGNLLFMLTNSEAFTALELFLCKEFSVENGYFYDSVEKFKQRCTEKDPSFDARAEARTIFEEYCAADASLSINISYKQRQAITKHFNEEKNMNDETFIPETLHHFHDAQTEVFELILRDSFRRFLLSREYRNYRKTLTSKDEIVIQPEASSQPVQVAIA